MSDDIKIASDERRRKRPCEDSNLLFVGLQIKAEEPLRKISLALKHTRRDRRPHQIIEGKSDWWFLRSFLGAIKGGTVLSDTRGSIDEAYQRRAKSNDRDTSNYRECSGYCDWPRNLHMDLFG